MKLSDIEASVMRHLYEQLQVPYGIKIYEDITAQDFTAYDKWVVIDSLGNPMGDSPVQHYHLHASIKNGIPGAKQQLNDLTDKLLAVVNYGTEIKIYSYTTKQLLGYMTVSDYSISPALQHIAGGAMRSVAISVVYEADTTN